MAASRRPHYPLCPTCVKAGAAVKMLRVKREWWCQHHGKQEVFNPIPVDTDTDLLDEFNHLVVMKAVVSTFCELVDACTKGEACPVCHNISCDTTCVVQRARLALTFLVEGGQQ